MALLLAAPSAVATTYKWTDAGGRVVYSDQPPAGNIKSEIVKWAKVIKLSGAKVE